MSISFYMTRRSRLKERSDLVALPVWVSRTFRHGNIFVREDSGLHTAADLAGRSIGLAEYGMTMAVWMRGIFADEAGLEATDIRWFTGRDPASLDDDLVRYPSGLSISAADRSVPLMEQVRTGAVDAMIGAGVAPLPAGVRRLFPDHAAVEREYYGRTGVFPIMHVFVLRREFVESRPDDVPRILEALERAKRIAQERLWSTSVSYVTLPWLLSAVEEQTAVMGPDPWPYGIEANLPTLTTLLRYMTEQGLLWDDLPLDSYFI
ncbi:ABC transporter substrate-binding protein [Nocardia jiangxiensis]|uniref:ABC transporter substrate-binding protein n=1 Tax=Nocardia jiangxiensis TaxID=282685 RepID=UPI0012F66EF4|nr:ABC transporter substrate-binding protein [Nocardia jiangxiensis]